MSLGIRSKIISSVVHVDVTGRLCFLEVALREHINGLLEAGHLEFVLNLAEVPYIDSFGLGQLILIWNSIKSRGGQLVLQSPTDQVRKLLQITKLNTVFKISEGEGEAAVAAGGSSLKLCR